MNDVKTLQQMHRDGRINRRNFLKVMGALGISAVAAFDCVNGSGGFSTARRNATSSPHRRVIQRPARPRNLPRFLHDQRGHGAVAQQS